MKKTKLSLSLLLLTLVSVWSFEKAPRLEASDSTLDHLEVRVIRPRFVDKKGLFEMGAQMGSLLNQDFVSVFQFSGHFQYHILHSLAFELSGSYGLVLKNTEYNILSDDLYAVKIQKYSPAILLGGALNWSPFYGKFQFFSGSLLYFDTFFSFGGGVTGVQLSYDHCPSGTKDIDLFPQYYFAPSGNFGLGQHFFFNKQHAVRWDFKYSFYMMDEGQSACSVEKEPQPSVLISNFIVKLGYSFFL